jgi:transposase
MATWLGLVPAEQSTGGKQTLLGISKRGNGYVRRLFIHEALPCFVHLSRESHDNLRWGGCRFPLTALRCAKFVVSKHKLKERASMEEVGIIGVDLAKNVFQLHGAAAGDGGVSQRAPLGT